MLTFYIKIVGLHFCTIHIVRINMKFPTHKTVKFSCEIGLEKPLKCGHKWPRNYSVWSNLQALPYGKSQIIVTPHLFLNTLCYIFVVYR